MTEPGFVDTPYGPAPGCPICGVIALGRPVLCEHGVTPAPFATVAFTFLFEDEDSYRALVAPTGGPAIRSRGRRPGWRA